MDDPFPIYTLTFWDNKGSFGLAEVNDADTHNKAFTDALLLVLEGFSPSQWQALGSVLPAAPSGATAGFPGITFSHTITDFENAALPLAPQRIQIPPGYLPRSELRFRRTGTVQARQRSA